MTCSRSPLLRSLALSAAVGCGGASAPTDAAPPSDTSGGERPAIAGHWVSGCVPTDTGALTLDFVIDEARWALDYDTYGDAACSAPFLTVHVEGPYELLAPSPTVDGAWNARFAFDEKTVTPHGEAAVSFLAGLGEACGGPGTWEDGAPRDVYAAGCAMLGQYPSATCTADHDVAAIDEAGLLHFGARPADNDMCTNAKRPTELSPLGLRRAT